MTPQKLEERLKSDRLTEKEVEELQGRLIFTSANSLKLVMPMPKESGTVAFLLHTQQPLSYLETLIRSEMSDKKQTASISFWDVHRHSRWSTGIQISDFIREGAATRKFCIDIKDSKETMVITVNVPSFEDRTQYLRSQLGQLTDVRKCVLFHSSETTSHRIVQDQYRIKSECDELARKTAQKYALSVMAGLVGYWIVVFELTFYTNLGWDMMEPVTYLTSLSALIGGYVRVPQ